MAKPRLRVYRALMGFSESVVAAPNQRAALDAWGTHQNLFAQGDAGTTDDPAAVEVATSRPGVVLQRPVGSEGAFRVQLEGQPNVPDVEPTHPRKAVKTPAKAKPEPDRSALTKADAALTKVDADNERALADIAHRRDQLDQEQANAERLAATKRKTAAAQRDQARRAFVRAGGIIDETG